MRVSSDKLRRGSISLVAIAILLFLLTFLISSLNPLLFNQYVKVGIFPSNSDSQNSANSSSATAASQDNNSSVNYWYVGASSSDSSSESNQGIRSYIQVRNQSITDGVLSFWVSEAFSNNLWAQAGYYIQNNSGTIAFYQIWNLTDRSEIVTGTRTVTTGIHLFSIELVPYTNTWNFSIDGSPFGSFDMQTNVSSASYPMYAMSEEGYAVNPFQFYPVLFQSAIQVYKSGFWENVIHANSYGNNWGIEGHEQNSLIGNDQILIGKGYETLNADSALWSQ